MGFVASEQVEVLTYDFNPHAAVSGTIPEPTSRQVDTFRREVMGSVEALGLDPGQLTGDTEGAKVTFADVGALMEKAGTVEQGMLNAVADLTGIPNQVLNGLPYRVQAAFAGWIVGVFLSPEA